MIRDDFVDLINAEGSDSNLLEEEGTLATVIKDDDLTVGDDRAMVGEKKIIESASFILKLHEKDSVVDSIDIECRCGRTARVQLEYKKLVKEDEEEVIENTAETEVTKGDTLIADTPTEPKTVEETGELKETDDEHGGDVEETAVMPGEPESKSDHSNDTEDTDEFQDGLHASVITTQNKEVKSKIIEPVQKKPDDADNIQ